ncbi:ATP-binding protein [Streptomyces sp. NBC_01537]|uniref:ATP-binding protein n=1 Tax=Streptomyces sp. NBC_01537 TaxID=2903896 RepID=UPI00386FDDB8
MDSLTGTVAQARRAVTAFVARVCPWADLDAVILVVSELVTNAVRHTTGWWQLSMEGSPDRLTVAVDDSSHTLPACRPRSVHHDGGGLGWHVVRTLASRVEITEHPAGKTIRAMWLRPVPDVTPA